MSTRVDFAVFVRGYEGFLCFTENSEGEWRGVLLRSTCGFGGKYRVRGKEVYISDDCVLVEVFYGEGIGEI